MKLLNEKDRHQPFFSYRVYGYPSIELRPGGGDESVTVHNVEEFVERTVDWALYRFYFLWDLLFSFSHRTGKHWFNGIEFFPQSVILFTFRGVRSQLEALRSGFNTVFPMDRLGAFTPDEVCSDDCCLSMELKYLFLDEDPPVRRPGPSVHSRRDLEVHGAQAWLHQGESRLPQIRQRACRAHWSGEEGFLAGNC